MTSQVVTPREQATSRTYRSEETTMWKTALGTLLMMAVCPSVFAASTIDPSARYAWGENIGWCDFYADGTNGVVVTPTILSGYVWCENVGWICLGDGTPETPPRYSNASAGDFGVNHDGAGNLSGYAWGENIGWVCFDTSGAGGSKVTISASGTFSGYAWAENAGWINMSSGYGVALVDSDDDNIPDAFETNTGTYVSPYDTGTDPANPDTDGDGLTDGDEVQVYFTDPTKADTDGDRWTDGYEVTQGTDPSDSASHPSYTVYVPWFYESVADAGNPLNGKLTFVCLVNASPVDETATARITYLSPNPEAPDEGPFDMAMGRGAAITWTPHSTAGGAEAPGIPNATFGAGSVRIESTEPVVGRVIAVDANNNSFVSMATQELVQSPQTQNEGGNYELYAPWFYESVSNAGNPLNGKLAFVCLVNASTLDATATARITYLPPDTSTPDEGPFDIAMARGAAITWTPHSVATGAETPGIPNASFGAGSVKVECTEPMIGRIIAVDANNNSFGSTADEPLTETIMSRNEADRYELYAPWFYESVTNAGDPLNGKLTFVCLVNTSAEESTVNITYLSPSESTPDEGPFEIALAGGAAITWTPHSTATGAETPGIPNATFGAGSVKIESTQPVVGRVIQVDCNNNVFGSMADQQLVEATRSVNEAGRYEVYAPWFYESVANAGDPLNGKLTFVCLVNASNEESTVNITYLSPGSGAPDEGPFTVTLPAGSAITWTPHSNAGGAETSGIPNATFGAGSVKIESTRPVVGRIIQVDCQNNSFVSMAAQPLVGRSKER